MESPCACHYGIFLHACEDFSQSSWLLPRARERNRLTQSLASFTVIRGFKYNVKNNAHGFRPAATSVSREYLRKLCSPIQTEQFRRADRHASKNDCRKRQCHDATRSQPVERNQLRQRENPPHCVSPPQPILSSRFWFSTTCCAARSRAQSRSSRRPESTPPARLPATLGASLKQLVIEKLSSDAVFRSRCARRQNRLHVFQHRRTPVRLRCQCAVAQHHRGKTSDFKRVCQRAWPTIRRRRSSWKNFDRRGDATDRDSDSSLTANPNRWSCRRCDRRSRFGNANFGARTRCHCGRAAGDGSSTETTL